MNTIEQRYIQKCNIISDINEHLPVLKEYASKCESIVEMGVRSIVSTWALLAGRPKRMLSIDILPPSQYGADINEVYSACKNESIHFSFLQADTLKVTIPECDMLFIDTLHTYEQLSKELDLHSKKAKKYLAFHDTVSFPEVFRAISDFLQSNEDWKVDVHRMNNNGLLILSKK